MKSGASGQEASGPGEDDEEDEHHRDQRERGQDKGGKAPGFDGEDDARRFCSAFVSENAVCIPVPQK